MSCFPQTTEAIRPVLTGNTAAGCERLGFATDGEPCTTEVNSAEAWADNVVHSALSGVAVMPDQGQPTCSLLANFTSYKSWDSGIYFQAEKASLEVIGYISIDNTIGLFPMVLRPTSISRQFQNKFIHVKDSIFVGTSDDFDCERDVLTNDDYNLRFSIQARPFRNPDGGGKSGLILPTFNQATNSAPLKPFYGIMAYPSFYGLMIVTGRSSGVHNGLSNVI